MLLQAIENGSLMDYIIYEETKSIIRVSIDNRSAGWLIILFMILFFIVFKIKHFCYLEHSL